MKPDLNNIFSSSSCLSLQDMKDYISGNMSDSHMRKIEMHIADCQMCNDELEGLSNIKDLSKLDSIISSIDTEIEKTVNEKFISSGKKFNLKRVLSLAAAIALLITTGYIINNLYDTKDSNLAEMQAPDEISLKEEKLHEVASEDSVKTLERDDSNFIPEEVETLKSNVEQKERISIVAEIHEDNEVIAVENEVSFDGDIAESEELDDLKEEIVSSDLKRKEAVKEDKSEEVVGSVKTDVADEVSSVATEEKKKSLSFGAMRGTKDKKKSVPISSEKLKGVKSSAELSYEEKVYDEAIEGFDKYLEYRPNDYDIIYKKGKSLYFNKKYPEALTEFDKIINSPSSTLKEDAEWYKTMCLMRLGKRSDAEKLLEKIVSAKGKYKDKAADVLKQIDDQ